MSIEITNTPNASLGFSAKTEAIINATIGGMMAAMNTIKLAVKSTGLPLINGIIPFTPHALPGKAAAGANISNVIYSASLIGNPTVVKTAIKTNSVFKPK